jgi:hypothetical protein
VWDNLNPSWVKCISFSPSTPYYNSLHIVIYDNDKEGSTDLAYHDIIGFCTVPWSRVAGDEHGVLRVRLTNPRSSNPGHLHLYLDRIMPSPLSVNLNITFGAAVSPKLKRAFIVLSRSLLSKPSIFVPVYRSEILMVGPNRTLSFMSAPGTRLTSGTGMQRAFAPHTISIEKLCGGDNQSPLRIQVFSHVRNGSHKLIATLLTKLATLTTSKMPVVVDASPQATFTTAFSRDRNDSSSLVHSNSISSAIARPPGEVAVLPRRTTMRVGISRDEQQASSKPVFVLHERCVSPKDETLLGLHIKFLHL